MTDDRAKRLRELRNRTGRNRNGSDETDSSDSNEPDSSDSDETDSSNPNETESPDSDGSVSSESGDSGTGTQTDADGTEPVESSVASSSQDGQPKSAGSDKAESPSASADEAGTQSAGAGEGAATPPEQHPETDTNHSSETTRTTSAENARTGAADTPTPAENVGTNPAGVQPGSSESAQTSTTGNAQTGSTGRRPVHTPTSDTAEERQSVSFDEREVMAEGTAQQADTQQIDPALQGAVADTAAVAGGLDTMGQEPTVDSSAVLEDTEEYGKATIGRDNAVFEQGNTLLHSAHDDENTVQMLEFFLNDSRYAIEIDRISAIVEMKDITRFPRGPDAIDGVTDLRGEITGVLDPTAMLDIERSELSDEQYIVVLKRSDDKQKLGIRVTDVSQAVTYRESQIDETGSVMDLSEERQHEFIKGIIKKTTDDQTSLVTWLDLDAIIENTN